MCRANPLLEGVLRLWTFVAEEEDVFVCDFWGEFCCFHDLWGHVRGWAVACFGFVGGHDCDQ